MKAVVLPFRDAGNLAPLRALSPDFLLPLVGKPLVEHLVERLVSCGVTDIVLLCDDRPDEISRYFGNGERWGCTLKNMAVREGQEVYRLLLAALHGVEGGVLCTPGNLLLSSGMEEFLARAAACPGSITIPATAPDCGLVIADAALLRRCATEHPWAGTAELLAAARAGDIPVSLAAPGCSILPVVTPADLLSLQRLILDETLTGFRIPARKAGDRIWIGDHAIIESGATLTAPVMIGSHSRIIGRGQIGPNAVIGSRCLLNNTDLIMESILLSGTMAGRHIELNGLAARGSILVNLHSGVTVTAPDPFILGEIADEAERLMPGYLPNAVAALALLLLLSPLALPLLLLSLVIPGMIRAVPLRGNLRLKTLHGEHPRQPFLMREFTVGPLLLRRWPALVPVVTGHLLLVGALPQAEDTPSDGTFGLDPPRGVFRIWEVEGDPPEHEEERLTRENFHAVTRTLRGDARIVLKAALLFPPPP